MCIKTELRVYCFNTSNPQEASAYKALVAELKASGLSRFCSHGGGSHYRPDIAGCVELEVGHLFADQWNTCPIGDSVIGQRVFDWAEDYNSSIGAPPNIKRGHYLVQVPEMAEVRRNTVRCGYCGKQEPAAKGYVFCPHCLGSAYLDEGSLHLTRMCPVLEDARPALTATELAHLLPLYKQAQIAGNQERAVARNKAQREAVLGKYSAKASSATVERDGMLWLLDKGANLDNVIFYDHTEVFSIGWRKPVSDSVAAGWVDMLGTFPYNWEVRSTSNVYKAALAANA